MKSTLLRAMTKPAEATKRRRELLREYFMNALALAILVEKKGTAELTVADVQPARFRRVAAV